MLFKIADYRDFQEVPINDIKWYPDYIVLHVYEKNNPYNNNGHWTSGSTTVSIPSIAYNPNTHCLIARPSEGCLKMLKNIEDKYNELYSKQQIEIAALKSKLGQS